MIQTLLRVREVIRRLRSPNGCPWNAARTADQLLGALEDETSELRRAIANGAITEIKEELGDVLFNLVALTETFSERDLFSLVDVDNSVSTKMIERHPYVFGDAVDPGPEEAQRLWEAAKVREATRKFQSRIGIELLCEGYGIEYDVLNDPELMEQVLRCLSAACGVEYSKPLSMRQPVRPPNPEVAVKMPIVLVGVFDAPAYLLVQGFPSGVVLISAFTDSNIDSGAVRDVVRTNLRATQVDLMLVDRGRTGLEWR